MSMSATHRSCSMKLDCWGEQPRLPKQKQNSFYRNNLVFLTKNFLFSLIDWFTLRNIWISVGRWNLIKSLPYPPAIRTDFCHSNENIAFMQNEEKRLIATFSKHLWRLQFWFTFGAGDDTTDYNFYHLKIPKMISACTEAETCSYSKKKVEYNI